MTYAFTCKHSYQFDFNSDDSLQNLPNFQNGEIINELEIFVMDILEIVLGDRFRYCPQVPLQVICSRSDTSSRLPDEDWKFWANSRVDIAVMEKGYCDSRKAKLVVECQSHYHDNLNAQARDRKKSRFLAAVGVPLVYVRRVEENQRFYRFYTPNQQQEVIYRVTTQEGRAELEAFLQAWL